MRVQLLSLVMAVALSACGNDVTANFQGSGGSLLLANLKAKLSRPVVTGDPNDPAIRRGIVQYRATLQADGQPLMLASNPSLKFGALFAPFGGNNGVETWSSTGYQTLSLRDGVLVATRGFGPDLMSSDLPPVATIAAGQGTTQRHYSYLDGADQPQTINFSCVLANAGPESIEVMAKGFATRKVTETCSGPTGGFTNAYWFDGSTNLRQSNQFFAPGLDTMFMQRVID